MSGWADKQRQTNGVCPCPDYHYHQEKINSGLRFRHDGKIIISDIEERLSLEDKTVSYKHISVTWLDSIIKSDRGNSCYAAHFLWEVHSAVCRLC